MYGGRKYCNAKEERAKIKLGQIHLKNINSNNNKRTKGVDK